MLADVDRPHPSGPPKRSGLTLVNEARVLAEGIPDGLLLVDHRGRILFANDRLLAMTGHAAATLVGAGVEVLVPTELRAAHVRHRKAFTSQPAHRPTGTIAPAFSVRRADGTIFPADIALNPTRWGDRDVVVVVVSDLTARRRAEDLRSMQFTVTRILSEATSLVEAGPRLLEVIGTTLGMVSGELRLTEAGGGLTISCTWSTPAIAPAPGEASEARSHGKAGIAAASTAGRDAAVALAFPVLSDGQVAAFFEFFSLTPGSVPAEVHESMRDIGDQIGHFVQRRRAETALEESLARLAEVAATDPLTGIRNRREFDRLLATAPRRRFAVLAADVDNLKRLNDEFGHEAGDVALRAVASTLVAALRGWDVVARTGGDEFSVLMSDVSAPEAARAAERVRAVVKTISVSYGQIGISVGWATGPAGADPRAIHDLADAHLYEAKRGGRDRVVGAPMSRRHGLAAHRSEWSGRIEEILADRNVNMVFQPVVRLADGTVVGHEALARPRGFGVTDSVEDLFAEAHRTGRIRELDWLCRRRAIAAVPWPLLGERAIFLNVSAIPLLDPVHPVDQMLLVLKASGASAGQVVLELTERELVSDMDRVREVLAVYREAGFRFALDDVGEGHSTLELLAAARPEFIKIARSLTMTASRAGSRAAIKAMVSFAHASGATVIAEGVENELAARQTRDLGAVLGQGWWLARPAEVGVMEVTGTRSVGRRRPELTTS